MFFNRDFQMTPLHVPKAKYTFNKRPFHLYYVPLIILKVFQLKKRAEAHKAMKKEGEL